MKYFIDAEYLFDEDYAQEIEVKQLCGGETSARIFSIIKTKSNTIVIKDGSDGAFEETYNKKAAIELFQEAIDWIKT